MSLGIHAGKPTNDNSSTQNGMTSRANVLSSCGRAAATTRPDSASPASVGCGDPIGYTFHVDAIREARSMYNDDSGYP
jgi:hypothetical protein